MGAAARVPALTPEGHHADPARGRLSADRPAADVIAEYLDETHGPDMGERRLMPLDIADRIEARRLTRWFNEKFYEEVSHWLVGEKIFKRFCIGAQGGGAPNMDAVRAARANLRYHLRYIGRLIGARNWLAGDTPDLRRSGGGGASVLRGLSGRRGVGRERQREDTGTRG